MRQNDEDEGINGAGCLGVIMLALFCFALYKIEIWKFL